ncbi:MAG: hypothetical protein RL220_575 [Bacteroidota bacterium]
MPKGKLLLVVLSCVALLVLFLWLPRQPRSAREESLTSASPDSLKLLQAIEMAKGPDGMQAAMMLREIVQTDSLNADAHFWLGVLSVRSGQIDKAISRYEKVISIDPNYLNAYIDLGGIYMEQGNFAKAHEWFDRTVKIDSTFEYGLLFKGRSLELQDSLAQAKAAYNQLLRHTSDTAIVKPVSAFIENINKKLNP